ncbi:Predicted arabinose efflux permease, MFS family [Asanoa hainanensis]|uniref:Predicted arabinose efflux permease, MFS family n=1 Tax=Asanoa hainanensis TaxID=560556 RepID=A0A239PCS8_9ACTN|nr:MFS transporter [Asanoa hainanensis]SNT64755.1 Predicted arabinose efflux permease, MFS family [Asanoa hainanensis]
MTLLADTDFRRYWLSRMVSVTGSLVTYVVLPVLIYSVTGSALWTALVVVAEGLPYLCFGLFAGALADRLDRRRVMVTADLVNAVVLGSIPAAYAFGVLTAPHVLVVAFLTQIFFVFFDAANFGALPALVGRSRIASANSAVHGGGTVLELVVPGLAGVLLTVAQPAPLLVVDAVSFAVSALLVRAIAAPLQVGEVGPSPGLLRDICEGLVFLGRQPIVRTQTIVGCLQSMTGGAFMGQFVPWLDQTLGVRAPDARLGVLYGVWGAGGIVAALLFPRVARRMGEPRVTLWFLPLSALFGLACGLATNWMVAAVLLALWAIVYSVVILTAITLRQRVTPDRLQSRVNTAGRMLSFGVGWPLGALIGGVVSETTNPRTAIIVTAAMSGLGVIVAWLSPLRRLAGEPIPDADDTDPPTDAAVIAGAAGTAVGAGVAAVEGAGAAVGAGMAADAGVGADMRAGVAADARVGADMRAGVAADARTAPGTAAAGADAVTGVAVDGRTAAVDAEAVGCGREKGADRVEA